jgi:hypothetical protein
MQCRESISFRMLCLWALLASACNDSQSFQQGGRLLTQSDSSLDATPGRSEEFPVSIFQERSLSWDSSQESLSETLSLVKGPLASLTLTQVERSLFEEQLIQGGDGTAKQQSFALKEAGHLDLLVVMDNSQSMTELQNKLASRLEPILSNIGNTNWRIAVVTTDSPCVRDVLTRQEYEQSPDGVKTRFGLAVSPGTGGSNVERGIQMAIEGFESNISCATVNGFSSNQWTRTGSSKVVLIVSNEENCGSADNEVYCSGSGYPHRDPDYFMAQGPANARVFGILPDFGTGCTDSFDRQPLEYIDLVARTGGQWQSFCMNDYSGILETMSANVGQIIHRIFSLDAVPDSGTLRIRVDGSELMTGYTVTGKTVNVEGSAISSNAVNIEISYVAGTAERSDMLPLSELPDTASISIKQDGIILESTKFRYDANSNAIVFDPMPPDRAVVTVRYRDNSSLPTEFVMPADAAAVSLRMEVNGTAVDESNFSLASSSVKFSKAPEDGASIKMTYYKTDELQLAYDVDPILAGFATSIGVRLGQGAIQTADITDSQIQLKTDEVAQFDNATIVYQFVNSDEFKAVSIPADAGELIWKTGVDQRSELDCPVPEVSLSGEMDLSCFVSKYSDFSISYRRIVKKLDRFELKYPIEDETSISVTVNGAAFNAFEVSGQSLIVDRSQLEDHDVIQVRYH